MASKMDFVDFVDMFGEWQCTVNDREMMEAKMDLMARWKKAGLQKEDVLEAVASKAKFAGDRADVLTFLSGYMLYAGMVVHREPSGDYAFKPATTPPTSPKPQALTQQTATPDAAMVGSLMDVIKRQEAMMESLAKTMKEMAVTSKGPQEPVVPELTTEVLKEFATKPHQPEWMKSIVKALGEYLEARKTAETQAAAVDIDDTMGVGVESAPASALIKAVWKIAWESERAYASKYVYTSAQPGVAQTGGLGKQVEFKTEGGARFFRAKNGTWVPCSAPPRTSCDFCRQRGQPGVHHWHFECPYQQWQS